MSDDKRVKLYLGCNQHPREGYINVDIEQYPGVDVVADLEKRWPWDDGSVDEIFTADLPEHLRVWYETPDWSKYQGTLESLVYCLQHPVRTYGIIHFMEEANRVLRVGGKLIARIPTTDSRAWAQDPTHVSYWNENTIRYFVDPVYRGIYPNMIRGKWTAIKCDTTVRNPFDEAWIQVILEKAA